MGVPLQERVLRLERALAAAVSQERYSDAASLRDALAALRHADPLLSKRDALQAAVENEDFMAAAALRDELALLTETLARGGSDRRVDRILLLRGRSDPQNALRVATVSREGSVELGLVPTGETRTEAPRIFLQPTWSPSGDYVAMTEVSFNVETIQGVRAITISDSTSRVIIMNAFDGSTLKSAPLVKPPFFYSWSPCGKVLTMLSNDPTSGTPKVAMSSMQIVAPAGGEGVDLDVVLGPLASGHPLLYDFCPRDSTRVVAHMGNISTVSIVPVKPFAAVKPVLTNRAGLFGTPQWHPLQGANGREVVLFAERELPEVDDDNRVSIVRDIDIKGSLSKDLPGVERMKEMFSLKENEDPKTEDNSKKGSTLDSLLGSGGSILENIFRRGARTLGFGDNVDDKSDSSEDDSDSTSQDAPENELGQRLAGGLRRFLPQPQRAQQQGEDKWNEKKTSPKTNRLVMCDVDNPENRRVLCKFSGVMAFKLSPDGKRLAAMVTDPATGEDEFTVYTGDFSPDSVAGDMKSAMVRTESAEADVILSTPRSRVLAFFWSPNSRRLLFLNSIRESRAGAAQWATFDTATNRVVRYEKFILSGIYIHCLNFFDQFAASMTPWSPDSDAFCYPGRELTAFEKERDEAATITPSSSPLLATLLMQRDGPAEAKVFSAWVQKVPDTSTGNTKPHDPVPVVPNAEYASWSPC